MRLPGKNGLITLRWYQFLRLRQQPTKAAHSGKLLNRPKIARFSSPLTNRRGRI